MNCESPVLCISAGMVAPKKGSHAFSRLHLYLNYGLLGLAGLIRRANFNPIVLHGRFESPEAFVERLVDRELLPNPNPILMSVPSSFALPWARRACRAIRIADGSAKIVVGGRWVVADDGPWIRSALPDADQYIPGVAENVVSSMFSATSGRLPQLSSIAPIPELDYQLLDGWKEFNPSVEVSRGCGMGCTFCAEALESLQPLKPPQQVAYEFSTLRHHYETATIHPYLEASFFRPSSRWITSLQAALLNEGAKLNWRTESRVDAISPKQVEMLADAGLRVLDLGLESASPRQLLAMQKTTDPQAYLRRASELLRACHANGVWTKVNVLLFPGESHSTAQETLDWLESHRHAIKGVSVGPTILFRYGDSSNAVLRSFEALGASEIRSGDVDRLGYAHLHLSREFPHDVAQEWSLNTARAFMNQRDYFDLKSFSYLPRSLAWEDFQLILTQNATDEFPFRIDA